MGLRYKAAIVGLGRIATMIDDEVVNAGSPRHVLPMSHMGSYIDVQEVDFVGGADPYKEQRDAFAKKHGSINLYSDYRTMIEKERPDIVSICTSARPRAEIVTTIASMNAGVKAIWAEKPIALTLEDADRMVDVCKDSGIILAVNCARRWDSWYSKAREIIDSGEIGEVMQVTVYQVGNLSHNSHMINLARFLAGGNGQVKWVYGDLESDEIAQTDDDLGGISYLAFENGVRALVRQDKWKYSESEVIGSGGRIKIINDAQELELWINSQTLGYESQARHLFPRRQKIESATVRAVRDLIHCIETGEDPSSSGMDGRHDLEVAIAVRESHRLGGVKVDLPISDRTKRINSYETLLSAEDLPRALQKQRNS